MQGPESLLQKLEITLPGAVASAKPAVLSPTTRTAVNGHFFWVSSPAALVEFRAAPHRYTGQLLDPVTHAWFEPDEDSPRRDIAEGILLFASAGTARSFQAAGQPFGGHAH